jgi:hypothetical protein
VLLFENVHDVDERVVAPEAGEEVLLLELLVVLLDEGPDDLRPTSDDIRGELRAGADAPRTSSYRSRTRLRRPCSRIRSSVGVTSSSVSSFAGKGFVTGAGDAAVRRSAGAAECRN